MGGDDDSDDGRMSELNGNQTTRPAWFTIYVRVALRVVIDR